MQESRGGRELAQPMNGAGVELGSAELKHQARPELLPRCPNPSAGISVLRALLHLRAPLCHTIFQRLLAQRHLQTSRLASAPGRAPGGAVLSMTPHKSISLSEPTSFPQWG